MIKSLSLKPHMDQFKHTLVWPTFRMSQDIYLYSLLPLHTLQRNGFYRCALCTLSAHSSTSLCLSLSFSAALHLHGSLPCALHCACVHLQSFPSGKYILSLDVQRPSPPLLIIDIGESKAAKTYLPTFGFRRMYSAMITCMI